MTAVPTIDLLLAEQDASERLRLDAACRDHGFFLLANHGMQPQIDAMWKASARFFAQSSDQKRMVLRTENQPLGYYDRELTKRMRDQKEVFDFMPSQNSGVAGDSSDLNQWPTDTSDSGPGFAAEFRTAMEAFTESAGTLVQEGWIDVPPSPNTIVVNLGDAMQVWTNDVYRAAIHRVTPMSGQPRYSTPYFFNPAGSTVLEPLAVLSSNAAPKYRAFTWKEFIQARISDNYADLGEDDTQISNYKIA